MIASYIQAMMSALVLSVLAFGAGWAIASIGVQYVERRAGLDQIRDRVVRCSRLESALESRRDQRKQESRSTETTVNGLAKRKQLILRKLREIRTAGDRLVRVIGEESTDQQRFLAWIANRYVSPIGLTEKRHAFIDSSWSQPQQVEVWAKSLAEARNLVEKRYPPSFGYYTHDLSIPGAEAGGQEH